MRAFTDLYLALDASTATHAKVAALIAYFRAAPALDAAWAAFFLTGRKFKRLVKSSDLRAAAMTASGLPEWLFAASYDAVGDLAETIALVLPPRASSDGGSLAAWIDERLAPLGRAMPRVVRWLGRHSLTVYMAHQPVLFALLYLIAGEP